MTKGLEISRRKPTIRERLLNRAIINRETGCWEWAGARTRQGYGRISAEGRRGWCFTHRVAYELFVGPIPDGLYLDHLCRNPPCCNPAHLEPVTPRENVLRSPINFSAVNARKTYCVNGHELTPENTYQRPDRPEGRGRNCLTCKNIRIAAWNAAVGAKRAARRAAAAQHLHPDDPGRSATAAALYRRAAGGAA